jgi:hypothetical protein
VAEETDMNAPVTIIKDERSTFRTACAQQVHVEAAGCMNFPAALMDISPSGFRAKVNGQIDMGAVVKLRYATNREAIAIVVWQTDTTIGCQFIAPLGKADVTLITRGFGLVPSGAPRFGHEAGAGAAD